MKFSNTYQFGFEGHCLGDKVKKFLGFDKISGNTFLKGEMSCDISIEELKEIWSSQDDRVSKMREYLASGKLKADVLSLMDVARDALVYAEDIERQYATECKKTQQHKEELNKAE